MDSCIGSIVYGSPQGSSIAIYHCNHFHSGSMISILFYHCNWNFHSTHCTSILIFHCTNSISIHSADPFAHALRQLQRIFDTCVVVRNVFRRDVDGARAPPCVHTHVGPERYMRSQGPATNTALIQINQSASRSTVTMLVSESSFIV